MGKLKINIAHRLALLMIGVNIAFFAVTPKPLNAVSIAAERHDPKDIDDDSRREEVRFFTAYEAIVPVVQFVIDHELIFTFDFFILEESDFKPAAERSPALCNYFKILFEQFISPNAP